MIKPTKRKAFNFLRSYFDVVNEIPEDKDKLSFLMAILNKQFLDQDPEELNFIVNLCYESQRHSIESSVKGWKRVHKTDLKGNPTTNPTTNPKEEEEKEEEEEKYVFTFNEFWSLYDYNVSRRKCESAWMDLSNDEKEVIKSHLPNYVKSTPDKKFRKAPYNYLKEEVYLNEVVLEEEREPMDKATMIRANEGSKASLDFLISKGFTEGEIKQEYIKYQKSIVHSFDDMTDEHLKKYS